MQRSTIHSAPRAGTAGRVAAGLLLVVAGFQAALAAGAPWGAAAFGGAHPGVLPARLRGTSAGAVVVYLLLAVVAGTQATGPTIRPRVLLGAAAGMGVGALLNLASPSFIERIIWTPVTIALVAALGREARRTV